MHDGVIPDDGETYLVDAVTGKVPPGEELLTGGAVLPVEERLWSRAALGSGTGGEHVVMSADIRGPVDPHALGLAVATVCGRHTSLGRGFVLRDGGLSRSADDPPPVPLTLYTVDGTDPAGWAEALDRIRRTEHARPFDVTTGPLVRAALLTRRTEDAVDGRLFLVGHPLAVDGPAMAALVVSVDEVYRTLRDRPGPGARESMGTARREREVRDRLRRSPDDGDYLKVLAEDLPEDVELPFSTRREAAGEEIGAVGVVLGDDQARALRAVAGRTGSSLRRVVLSALAVLVHRSAGCSDVVLGVEQDLRGEGQEAAVGPFTDVLPVRIRLGEDPTWRDVVERVGAAVDEAVQHAAVGAEDLAAAAGRAGLAGEARLPAVVGVRRSLPTPDAEAALVARDVSSPPVNADLHWVLADDPDALRAEVIYRGDRFAPDQARCLVDRVVHLLGQLTECTDTHLSELSLLDPAEHRLIVTDWNHYTVDYPGDRMLHSLVEDFTDPDAVALSWDGTEVTYEQLDLAAEVLAGTLRALGVRDETRVGLYFGYSPAWVLGALATLKAGGVYVPLDNNYPEERLRTMCAVADVRVLLVHGETAGRLSRPGLAEVVLSDSVVLRDADDERARASAARSAWRAEQRSPDALAYIMFTSGSTGTPKAIGVTHRNIIATLIGTRPDYIRFDPSMSVAQSSSISFDATTFETWGALVHGCRLVGLRRSDVLDPHRLKQRLLEERIDVLFIPAALMKQHVSTAPDTFSSLQYFYSGGEQADADILRRIVRHGAPGTLINPYGPTETTVFAVIYRANDMPDSETHVPIGLPIESTSCYIVDQYLQPVPVGVIGELLIGGPRVARGYIGQPDVTAQRFVPDPYGDVPGGRLYRSGDLAAYRPDGVIDFFGRADRQAKIRGFRVEPGEIEVCLQGHPSVATASVHVDTDRSGDQILVAYVVPRPDGAADPEVLREHARRNLPAYMVPSRVVPVRELPQTPNGKLDVAALRAAAQDTPDADGDAFDGSDTDLVDTLRSVLMVDRLVPSDPVLRGRTTREIIAVAARARETGLPIGLDQLAGSRTAGDLVASLAPARPRPAQPRRPRPAPQAPAPAPQTLAPQTLAPQASARQAPATQAPARQDPVSTGAPAPSTGGGRPSAPGDVPVILDRLLEIWREVLAPAEVGPDDDFFDVGGHSLKITRIASHVRREFGVELPLATLFAHRTARSCAEELVSRGAAVQEVTAAGAARGVEAVTGQDGTAAAGAAGPSAGDDLDFEEWLDALEQADGWPPPSGSGGE